MTDSDAPPSNDPVDEEPMLTTGDAAELIGFGTTRKQVDAMIRAEEIAYLRPGPGAWARIPLSAALAKRHELERLLAESKARVRAKERQEQPDDD